jgi:hypothetical protein
LNQNNVDQNTTLDYTWALVFFFFFDITWTLFIFLLTVTWTLVVENKNGDNIIFANFGGLSSKETNYKKIK